MDRRIRALQAATGDAVIVVAVPTFAPYGSIEEYAVKLFERAGIGVKGKDNGVLILVAVQDRRARIEVGYGLEGALTDGFSGDIIRMLDAAGVSPQRVWRRPARCDHTGHQPHREGTRHHPE